MEILTKVRPRLELFALGFIVPAVLPQRAEAHNVRFHLQEATIADVHRAIRSGQLTCRQLVPAPGLPFSLVFRAEPGREDVILRVASAHQTASKRCVPPPMYKPLPGEP